MVKRRVKIRMPQLVTQAEGYSGTVYEVVLYTCNVCNDGFDATYEDCPWCEERRKNDRSFIIYAWTDKSDSTNSRPSTSTRVLSKCKRCYCLFEVEDMILHNEWCAKTELVNRYAGGKSRGVL